MVVDTQPVPLCRGDDGYEFGGQMGSEGSVVARSCTVLCVKANMRAIKASTSPSGVLLRGGIWVWGFLPAWVECCA